MKNQQQGNEIIQNQQMNKKLIDSSSIDQKIKRISEQQNHIPLYLSNSSFQFDQQQQIHSNNEKNKGVETIFMQEIKNSHQKEEVLPNNSNNSIYYINEEERKNNKFLGNEIVKHVDIPNDSESSSDILCRNRKLFTQQQAMKEHNVFIQNEFQVYSNKQERAHAVKQSQDNLFVLYNPHSQLNAEDHQQVVSLKQHQKLQDKLLITNGITNQERNITNKTENPQQTFATSENEDDYNQEYYNNLHVTNEQTNYLNQNLCDMTTITDSVQANEDFKVINSTSIQKKNNIFESQNNSLEIELNKKQRIQLKNVLQSIQDKENNKNDSYRAANYKGTFDSKYNLSQIILNKEQELIDLREQKRKKEELNSKIQSHISVEEHMKQVKELKTQLLEKDSIIQVLREKIQGAEQILMKEDQLQEELKERDQIINALQKDLKDKICDQESYKDKIKFYHEQSVKQQTNDILVCQLNSTIKEQQYQIDKFEMTQKLKDDTIEQLENQIVQLKQSYKLSQEDLSKLRTENSELTFKINDSQRDQDFLQKQLQELQHSLDSLNAENKKIKEQNAQKMQQANQNQEQKYCSELEQQLGQTFTCQLNSKNYTLGNEQIQTQIKKINSDINSNQNEDFHDYANGVQNCRQIQEGKCQKGDNRRNSLNKSNYLNSSYSIIQPEQKLNRTQLNVSALNLSSEACDIPQNSPIQNSKPLYETRVRDRNSSQESIQNYYINPQKIQQNMAYFLQEKENNYTKNIIEDQYIYKPKNKRSNSSYDNYQRASSSQSNYQNIPPNQLQQQNQIGQSQVSYQPQINYSQTQQKCQQNYNSNQITTYDNQLILNNEYTNLDTTIQNNNIYQPLQERRLNNQPPFKTANTFFRQTNDKLGLNQTLGKINYITPQNQYNKSLYTNKENACQYKQQLNQTYEYITNVRSSSPLNTSVTNSFSQKQQPFSNQNEKLYTQINHNKIKFGVPPPIPISTHQAALASYNKLYQQ